MSVPLDTPIQRGNIFMKPTVELFYGRIIPQVKAKESLWHVVQATIGLGLTLLTHVNQY